MKAIILTTLLTNDPMIIEMPSPVKVEMKRRRGKGNKGRRRGGNGLR
jgi:N-methylhydantoinase B/oxoprolinase/acetone carboxylase alpha subunit